MSDQGISINKFISESGYCSRREADELIHEERVYINQKLAFTGNRVNQGDVVEVDGMVISLKKEQEKTYIAFYKPKGITTTTDENVRDNIITFLRYPKRIFPIGRLDKDSEGLILLTNDGDIVNKILRSDNQHEKEYIVELNKPFQKGFIQKMSSGVPVLNTITKPCKVKSINRSTFKITLTQGLNRQIRRMVEFFDYKVIGLVRTRVMNIELKNLQPGKWRNLNGLEIEELQQMLLHSKNTASVSQKKLEKAKKFGKPKNKLFSKDKKIYPDAFTKNPKNKKNAATNTDPNIKKNDSTDPKLNISKSVKQTKTVVRTLKSKVSSVKRQKK